jgi:transposase
MTILGEEKMEKPSNVHVRYSESFQKKVVEEIQKGKFSIEGARKYYSISGSSTVSGWIKKWGRKSDLPRRVVIEMPNEKDEKKALKEEIKKLKLALADSVIKNKVYECLIEVVDEHYQTDVKKNFSSNL